MVNFWFEQNQRLINGLYTPECLGERVRKNGARRSANSRERRRVDLIGVEVVVGEKFEGAKSCLPQIICVQELYSSQQLPSDRMAVIQSQRQA